jgi:hypothetical protein
MSRQERNTEAGARQGGHSRRHAEIEVARRYLDHGFLDAAMRVFRRHVAHVPTADWTLLVECLLERGRIAEAVEICGMGEVPLPREQLLTLGDRHLRRKDIDGAVHYYELAEADQDRWNVVVDLLSRLPGRELQAIALAERHLVRTESRVRSFSFPFAASA